MGLCAGGIQAWIASERATHSYPRHPREPGRQGVVGAPSPIPAAPDPEQLVRGSTHRGIRALENDIRDWIGDSNTHPRPLLWTETAE